VALPIVEWICRSCNRRERERLGSGYLPAGRQRLQGPALSCTSKHCGYEANRLRAWRCGAVKSVHRLLGSGFWELEAGSWVLG
jgi:hypothetical protein